MSFVKGMKSDKCEDEKLRGGMGNMSIIFSANERRSLHQSPWRLQ